MKTEDFSSCYAGPTFANEMAIPLHSLHWNMQLRLPETYGPIRRSCSNKYLKTANKATVQGSIYEEKFGYVFMTFVTGRISEDILAELKTRFNNTHVVELQIASKEELKYIERSIRELLSKKSIYVVGCMYIYSVSAEYSGEIVDDTLEGANTDSEDDLDAISSGGYDISMNVELNKVPEEDNETLYTQHREDDIHAVKRGFDLNKKPWFGDDLSDPLSRDCSRFLTEYFWPDVHLIFSLPFMLEYKLKMR
ncbi:hypothetical protein Ahy_A07g034003 [Arachis hypogaea]|uniref:Oxo-4-hydroxy-4-carboxy-5-ureidoimidazoline decarboxylase domain-containing protein n=1 Tax=Arachis hypogaea TaxID=3818 RepID=A0A445CAS5_ARAHY|nr:hypothetical protein Ahy_A07g034003 [Arachis hypogaea]